MTYKTTDFPTCALGKIGFIIMAAGHGTRMRSKRNKVLHPVGGLPMVNWVLNAVLDLHPSDGVVVVGPHNQDPVSETVSPIRTVVQDDFPGTGGAVKVCRQAFKDFQDGTIVILNGDTPLITTDIIRGLVQNRLDTQSDISIMGFYAQDPSGYGRIITDDTNGVRAIVEHKECTDEQRTIDMCYSGIMAVDASVLFDVVDMLDNDNTKGEYYLTDIIRLATAQGRKVSYDIADEQRLMGCDTKIDLATAESIFQYERRLQALANGTMMQAPETVFFAWDTTLGDDVIMEPNVYFGEGVHVGNGCHIRGFSHIEDATLGDNVTVGPFARVRPETVLHQGAKIGSFVEVKASTIGAGSKINHLSYVGDTTIGDGTTFGAGAITCNYNGYHKNPTTVGNNVFVGSNSALIAPVCLGDNAVVGAGSVITQDVPKNAVGFGRAKQTNKSDYAPILRKKLQGE